MKKILIASDSHGNLNNLLIAVKRENPDMVIHLGDGWSDAQKLKQQFPQLILEQVPGNCDMVEEQTLRVLQIEEKKILICHGHTLRVKMGYRNLHAKAQELEVDLALFGHTHKVFYEYYNRIKYFNPGSIGAPGYRIPPSYGILKIDGETDTLEVDAQYIKETN